MNDKMHDQVFDVVRAASHGRILPIRGIFPFISVLYRVVDDVKLVSSVGVGAFNEFTSAQVAQMRFIIDSFDVLRRANMGMYDSRAKLTATLSTMANGYLFYFYNFLRLGVLDGGLEILDMSYMSAEFIGSIPVTINMLLYGRHIPSDSASFVREHIGLRPPEIGIFDSFRVEPKSSDDSNSYLLADGDIFVALPDDLSYRSLSQRNPVASLTRRSRRAMSIIDIIWPFNEELWFERSRSHVEIFDISHNYSLDAVNMMYHIVSRIGNRGNVVISWD